MLELTCWWTYLPSLWVPVWHLPWWVCCWGVPPSPCPWHSAGMSFPAGTQTVLHSDSLQYYSVWCSGGVCFLHPQGRLISLSWRRFSELNIETVSSPEKLVPICWTHSTALQKTGLKRRLYTECITIRVVHLHNCTLIHEDMLGIVVLIQTFLTFTLSDTWWSVSYCGHFTPKIATLGTPVDWELDWLKSLSGCCRENCLAPGRKQIPVPWLFSPSLYRTSYPYMEETLCKK